MAPVEITVDQMTAAPAPPLRSLVRRYIGYRYAGMAPGFHRGLPSPDLTIILSLGPPTRVWDGTAAPVDYPTLAAGLDTAASRVEHDGEMFGIELDMTPAGARSLLGLPAAELARTAVTLDELIGASAQELVERLREAPEWRSRFAILDVFLMRRMERSAAAASPLEHAWRLILGHAGTLQISAVADLVGWSRRNLDDRFAREYGLRPKEVARVARFHRSNRLLRADPGMRLASLAATCGYFDQAHMARDWNLLAGCPPSQWLADENLPFFQDDDDEWMAA